MASDIFDFLYSESTNTDKTQDNGGYVNLTARADMDCQVLCDGEFLFLMNANQITKERVPVGSHIIQFVSIEFPDLCIEKVVDFSVAGRSYLVLADEFKKTLSQRAKEKAALEAEIKAKADAEEAARRAEAEAKARAKAEAEERARAEEEAKARARTEAEAKARAELEARTPKLGTLRIASRRIANLEARYEGFILNGKPEGHGVAYYDNGHVYDGNWSGGLKSGHGTYVWPSGERYDGEWLDDAMCGHGTYLYSDGKTCYDGEFKDGRRNGKGVVILENGNRCVAVWKNGGPCPPYRIYFKSGGYLDGDAWYGSFPSGSIEGVCIDQDGRKHYYEKGCLICSLLNDNSIHYESDVEVLVIIKYQTDYGHSEVIGAFRDIELGNEQIESAKSSCFLDEDVFSTLVNLRGATIRDSVIYIALEKQFDSANPPSLWVTGDRKSAARILEQRSGQDFTYYDYKDDFFESKKSWELYSVRIKGMSDHFSVR